MLQNRLENLIANKIRETGTRVTIIIMHPETWGNLFDEATSKDSIAINKFDGIPKYKEIKVTRSLDILENEFELK